MLDHLGLEAESVAIVDAIKATTASGVLTPDLGGTASTADVTDAVLAHLAT
jgi:tartrate dehydrogenase/decarboxylase / D-malate dehydrogenase